MLKLHFYLRDLFWLILVIGTGLGIYIWQQKTTKQAEKVKTQAITEAAELKALINFDKHHIKIWQQDECFRRFEHTLFGMKEQDRQQFEFNLLGVLIYADNATSNSATIKVTKIVPGYTSQPNDP